MNAWTPYLQNFSFFFTCLMSVFLGGLVGLEREIRDKPAGLKTHVLISLGATILTYLSIKFSHNGDPGRIAAQIVSGIGFIGAGTILQSKISIQGLTTAATIWMAAAIGMLVGAGLIIPAAIATAVVLPVMMVSPYLWKGKRVRRQYALTIEITKLNALEKIEDMIQSFDFVIESKTLKRANKTQLALQYRGTPLTNHIFLKRLLTMKGIGKVIRI